MNAQGSTILTNSAPSGAPTALRQALDIATSGNDCHTLNAVRIYLRAALAERVDEPPASEPLTAEFIEQHIGSDEGDREAVTALVREVERAHGIGVKT